MNELLARLRSRPFLTLEFIGASFFITVLALASPLFVMQVLNRYIAHGVDATLVTLTAGVIIAVILELAFKQIRMRLGTNINGRYDRLLASGVFGSLTTLKTSAAEQMTIGTRQEMVAGAEKIQAAYTAANMATIIDVPFSALFIVVLFILNQTIGMFALGFMAFTFLIVVYNQLRLRKPTRELQNSSMRKSGIVGSTIMSGDTTRAFNGGGFIRDLWEKELGTFFKNHQLTHRHQGWSQSLNASLQALMGVGVISIGAVLAVRGEFNTGAMIGANILAARALMPIVRLASLGESFAKAGQALRMFAEIAKLPLEPQQGTALKEYQGGLEFQDFGFMHPGSKSPLYESLTMKIAPGTSLIFSGANGSGKTTFARLIVGILEPSRGRILIDGVDLAQIAPEWWRRQICYLPQEPSFLNASFADNIKIANPKLDNASLGRLIETAGLRSFIDQSNQGLNTQIINNGNTLAPGIRRRLALARALATDGKLVIIDEPSEGLDPEGINTVLQVINNMTSQGRTVLIFSHDPGLAQQAAQFIDLNYKPTPKLVQKNPVPLKMDTTIQKPGGDLPQ